MPPASAVRAAFACTRAGLKPAPLPFAATDSLHLCGCKRCWLEGGTWFALRGVLDLDAFFASKWLLQNYRIFIIIETDSYLIQLDPLY